MKARTVVVGIALVATSGCHAPAMPEGPEDCGLSAAEYEVPYGYGWYDHEYGLDPQPTRGTTHEETDDSWDCAYKHGYADARQGLPYLKIRGMTP